MFTLWSCVRAIVACGLILLVADVFAVCCAHSLQSVAHRRRHMEQRALVGPEVVRTRRRRGHAKHNYAIGRRSRRRQLAKHHRRRFHDDDVVVRETDKMSAEAINGLFGPRQFAPIAPLHRPAEHDKVSPGKPTTAGRGSRRHRHHHKTDDRDSAEKTFMLELPVGCEAEPCQNDGDCYTDPSSSLGYACRCQPGYTGDFCEIGKLAALVSVNTVGCRPQPAGFTTYCKLQQTS